MARRIVTMAWYASLRIDEALALRAKCFSKVHESSVPICYEQLKRPAARETAVKKYG
jgi:hypothetical protein